MAEEIKFATLEKSEVRITIEDAKYISLESETVASILAGKKMEEKYADKIYGGAAVILALEYCRKLGEIKYRSSQPSESKSDASNNFTRLEVETKCKEVDKEAWIADFTVRITNYGPGMAYELLAVSLFLGASGLLDLTRQCIFDYLTFKDYRDFRKAFAFQFLFPPYSGREEIEEIGNVLERIIELPTLDKIHDEFKDKIPFTADELELAESENKSVRIGGNLEYKTNKRSIEELLIKVEYMVRRLSSYRWLSFWITNAFAECITETFACLKGFFDDQSNGDIGKLCLTLYEPGSKFHKDFVPHPYQGDVAHKIANPSRSYEDINAIKEDMDKIELELAAEASLLKRKAEESCERCLTNWQNGYPHHKNKHKRKAEELLEDYYTNCQNDHLHHKDKVFPHLIYFLENRYQEIYCALCSLRIWMSAHEVQYYFNELNVSNETTFEYAYDQNEDQDEDVESEGGNEDCHEDEGYAGGNEDCHEDEGNKVLHSQESEADSQIRNDIVESLMRWGSLAVGAASDFGHVYELSQKLQMEMRMANHVDLLIKDEEMLAFICKEKFNLYMRASKQGTASTISFAENKEEFDRIEEETEKKFGDRGPVIEEAKKKYFEYYRKFHYAMVDETKRQMELNSKYVNGMEVDDMIY